MKIYFLRILVSKRCDYGNDFPYPANVIQSTKNAWFNWIVHSLRYPFLAFSVPFTICIPELFLCLLRKFYNYDPMTSCFFCICWIRSSARRRLCIVLLSESTEYSDWEPDGINLQPPKRRSQRHIKRRRWSSLEASESSDADADERRHGDDKAKVKVKVESDDEETGKKSPRKKSRTRSRKRVTARKQKRQVSYRIVLWFS